MLQRPVTWTLLRHTALTAAPASAPGSIDGAAIDAASSAPVGTAPAAATPACAPLQPQSDPPRAAAAGGSCVGAPIADSALPREPGSPPGTIEGLDFAIVESPVLLAWSITRRPA